VNLPSSFRAAEVNVFHIRNDAVFDPATEGAITSVAYSEDTFTGISQIGGGLALQQNGILYFGGYRHDSSTSWVTYIRSSLTAADFRTFVSETLHPDFSSSGAPITFGFFRANSVDAGGPYGYTATGGTDNWQATITSVPEPALLSLMALGGLAMLRRRYTSCKTRKGAEQ
jgi:hypothetical protein